LYFQCGLVVVDSPGIGENAEMDKVVMDFVDEQQINAFMYAIKSDNAGGVDEDRVCSYKSLFIYLCLFVLFRFFGGVLLFFVCFFLFVFFFACFFFFLFFKFV
jgi:hypothetical protein